MEESVPWIAPPYVAAGVVTELDGKPKSSGKTTFILKLCAAVLDGQPFLGHPTRKTRVVYLSEQNRASIRPALSRAGLLDRDDLTFLFWADCARYQWADVCAAAVTECERRGAGLLVVDTIGQFAGWEDENSAVEALKAMQPLQLAAGGGLAVVLSRHDRKSGGEVGDSGRGSNALTGAVDIVLSLGRVEGNAKPELRVLRALSRFEDTPRELYIELTEDGYIAHGDKAAIAEESARAAVRDALPCNPDKAVKEDELLKLTGDISRSTLRRVLEDPEIQRVGGGKKGDPFRYWRDANLSDQA
ncbi:MAG TPA: AAA family ATPase [Thermoanaerobaculia bacterium]|jgi:hypothetical protein